MGTRRDFIKGLAALTTLPFIKPEKPKDTKKYVWGKEHSIRSAQLDVNKHKSQMLAILNKKINSGWVMADDI